MHLILGIVLYADSRQLEEVLPVDAILLKIPFTASVTA